ncbi:hypothetical protein Ndes2437B_g05076 [Nannochloris sp. 'desiccata']
MLEQKNEENTVVEEATNTVTTTTTSTKALPVVDMSTALIAPPQSKEPKIVSALNVQAPEFTVAVGPTPAAATPRLTAVSIVPSIGTLNPAAKEFNFSVAPFTKSEGSVEEERKESALHANVEEFKCPKVASLVAAATATAADADAGAATLGASRYENVENEESKGEIVLAEDTIIIKINTGVVIDIVASSLSFCARATIKSTAHTSASPSIPTPAALKSTPAPLKNQENGHEGLFIRTFRVVANVLASAAAVGYVGCCYVRTAKPALRPKYVKWDAQGRRTPLDDDIVACKEYNDQEATETEAEEEEEVEKGQETNDAWSSGDAAVSFEKEMKKEEEEVEIPYAIACSSYHVDDEGSSDCESVVSLVAGVGAIAREEDGRSLGPHEEIKKEKEKKHEFSFCAIGKKEPVVEKRIEPFQVVAIGKAAADPEQPGILALFVHIVAYLLCVIPLFALLKVDTAAKAVKQMRASTRQRVQKVTEAAVCARSKAISYLRTAVLVCIAAGSVVVIFSGVLIIKFLYHLQPKYFVALSVVAGAPALCAVIGGVAGAARMKVTASYCLPKCSKASLGPLYTLYCQHVKTNHVETTPISFTKFCSIMSAEAVKAPKRRIPNTFEEPKNGFVNISALNVAEEASRVKDDEAATFFFKSFQDVLFGSKSQINTPKPTSHHQSTVLVTEDKENDNSTTTTATTTKAIAAVDVVAADNVIAPGPQPKEPKTVPTLASNATEFTFPKLQPVTTAPFPPTAAGKVFRSKSTPQAQEGVLDSEISTKLAPVVKNTFTFNINAPDFVLPNVTSLRASATTTPTVTSSKLHPAAHEFVFPAMSTQPHSSVKPTMRASALNPNAKGYTRPYQMTSSASAPLFENAAKAVISPVVISTTKFSPDVLATMDVDSLYELSLKAFKMKDFNGRFYPAHIFDPAGIVATRLRERNTAGTILVLQPFAANECLSPKERTYWAVHTIECIEHADFFGLRGTDRRRSSSP